MDQDQPVLPVAVRTQDDVSGGRWAVSTVAAPGRLFWPVGTGSQAPAAQQLQNRNAAHMLIRQGVAWSCETAARVDESSEVVLSRPKMSCKVILGLCHGSFGYLGHQRIDVEPFSIEPGAPGENGSGGEFALEVPR